MDEKICKLNFANTDKKISFISLSVKIADGLLFYFLNLQNPSYLLRQIFADIGTKI